MSIATIFSISLKIMENQAQATCASKICECRSDTAGARQVAA